MVRAAKDWPWSSYKASAGQVVVPEWLNVEWLLASFSKKKKVACERYRKFVAEGTNQPAPWDELKNQIFLGDDQFVETMQALINEERDLSEVPVSQRRPRPKSLTEYNALGIDRNEGMAKAYLSGGYSLKDIGEHFGLHYSTVSRIVKSAKHKTCPDLFSIFVSRPDPIFVL